MLPCSRLRRQKTALAQRSLNAKREQLHARTAFLVTPKRPTTLGQWPLVSSRALPSLALPRGQAPRGSAVSTTGTEKTRAGRSQLESRQLLSRGGDTLRTPHAPLQDLQSGVRMRFSQKLSSFATGS